MGSKGLSFAARVALVMVFASSHAAGQARVTPKPTSNTATPKSLAETLTGQAKADYEAGKLLFSDGDFAGAAIKFKGAYDQSSDARLLWDIAACEKQQRHYARAVALVQRYMRAPVLTDADRAEAKALLDAIEPFTVALTIKVNESGADVLVDDVSVGSAPLPSPIVVDLGMRKITVRKTGFVEATVSQPLGGSKDATVEVVLKPEVHEGEITVTSAPNAHIFLDGAAVGVGSFKRRLKSGGYTLRVVADGMQPYQTEIVVTDDEKRTIDVPLTPMVQNLDQNLERETDYRGVYGRMSFQLPLFGFGTGYTLPQGVQGSVSQSLYTSATFKVNVGYAVDWYAFEFVSVFMFTGRIDETVRDPSGTEQLRFTNFGPGGFFGLGGRATAKNEHVRVTAGVAAGAGPHVFLGTTANVPNETSQEFSPSYVAFALAGDLGLLIGRTPGAKFYVAVDWYLELPPDVVVGPDNTPGIPPQYFNAGPTQPRGWKLLQGPQFFIGPALGVQWGH